MNNLAHFTAIELVVRGKPQGSTPAIPVTLRDFVAARTAATGQEPVTISYNNDAAGQGEILVARAKPHGMANILDCAEAGVALRDAIGARVEIDFLYDEPVRVEAGYTARDVVAVWRGGKPQAASEARP